jgi:2-oxoglutarate ferredoxin oxidoreductase subunit gamma
MNGQSEGSASPTPQGAIMQTAQPYEIRIAGFGGQGVILAAMILGRAVSIVENKHATLVQSFGPEARGGACSAQLVLSDDKVLYPYVKQPNLLVAMSQEGLRKYVDTLRPDGTLIYEADLVDVDPVSKDLRLCGVPATAIAETLRRRIVTNIVMVGFIAAVAGVIGHDAAREAVMKSVPPGTEGLNGKAFELGYDYGVEHYGKA